MFDSFLNYCVQLPDVTPIKNNPLPKDFHKDFISKEDLCRNIFKQRYNIIMQKKRPPILKFDSTKGRLEFDGYNENIITSIGKGLAFEYNGPQHYNINYGNKYKKSELARIMRYDKLKVDLCKDKKIALITIPYTVKKENIACYIHKEIKKFFNI
uniref:Restriction-fold (UvrB-like) nuclease n=2 Tax=unclassified viruses TaxID=12429 RepID=A0A6G9HDH8_9VIRU|nr:helicase [Dikerogammarus haemobaphes bi-facies-like virus]QIQ08608.1 restriction-fold (UvrB-like) nuclease [Dikerogammarus haemobaphes virus 1]